MSWQRVTVERNNYRFPNRCPDCLKYGAPELLSIASDFEKVTGYYVVAIKYEHLRVGIPFCTECAAKRIAVSRYVRWLFVGAFLAGVALSVWLDVGRWGAFALVVLFVGPITWWMEFRGKQHVRLTYYSDKAVTFAFEHPEYADDFARLNNVSPEASARTIATITEPVASPDRNVNAPQFIWGLKRGPNPYVEAGTRLTREIVEALGLTEWQNGIPPYTSEEANAIDAALSRFARETASRAPLLSRGIDESPGLADGFKRITTATSLKDLAGERWKYSADVPEDWNGSVSTYLKAFACDLDPLVMLEMSDLLAKAGYKGEARRALQVVLLYPSYVKEEPETVRSIVELAQTSLRDL